VYFFSSHFCTTPVLALMPNDKRFDDTSKTVVELQKKDFFCWNQQSTPFETFKLYGCAVNDLQLGMGRESGGGTITKARK